MVNQSCRLKQLVTPTADTSRGGCSQLPLKPLKSTTLNRECLCIEVSLFDNNCFLYFQSQFNYWLESLIKSILQSPISHHSTHHSSFITHHSSFFLPHSLLNAHRKRRILRFSSTRFIGNRTHQKFQCSSFL